MASHGGRRSNAGRKPEAGERRHLFPVPLTDAEQGELTAAAGEMPLATWLRDLGLRAARRR